MAEEDKSEKTEQPTARRLQQAQEKGDVPKSQEISGWFLLAAGLAILAFMVPGLSRAMALDLRLFFANAGTLSLDPGAALQLVKDTGIRIAILVAFVFLTLLVAGLMGHFVQHGLMFTPSKLEPKLSKLNPAEGMKRMFGPQGWMNFLKGLGKLALVGAAMTLVLWPKKDELAVMALVDLGSILGVIREASIQLMIAALIVYAIIAGADYLFQRHEFTERNKMSRREIKDEYKDTEGDPLIRAKLRQIRMERSQRRMMANVPQASVVVTNPTHYAVALKYVQGETPAPVCLAKGVDKVALKIREIAEEHNIPIVEDPPLARALYASAELDELIPETHYKAVAKIIGYVMSLAKGRRDRDKSR